MKIKELCETTAGSVASVSTSVGKIQSRRQYNPDGTLKNGLDADNVLSNGKPKTKNKKTSK